MKNVYAVAALCFCFVFISYGQNYPYPQNVKYPYGFSTATVTTAKATSWYNSYKARPDLLQACNGGIRAGVDGGTNTKVEAMGWAMIIAAYMGDKATFDGLYTFYKSKCRSQNGGMMDWHVTCPGVVAGGSATDGDMDVGFSLVVASWQWGATYLTEALKVIANLKKLIVNCNGVSALRGGYGYGGCNETDISYYTPAFLREFAKVTNDAAWTKLADDTYTILNNGANATTGLVPDWQTVAGVPGPNGRNGTYRYDACRVPWRMTLDYLWNGNARALAWCKKVSGWADGIGAANIRDGYNLNGSLTGSYHNMAFVGSFAVSSMCNSQAVCDRFGTEVARMSFDTYWYHAYLGNCYLLALTGNMWSEDLIKNTRVKNQAKLSAAGGMNITITGNRKLNVSGLRNVNSVVLTDLAGQRILQSGTVTGDRISLDISSLKHGCYLVGTVNEKGQIHKGQKVFVY
jgi:endo-1,4-beta-D-glucanase Y